jgi:hypothetical protein
MKGYRTILASLLPIVFGILAQTDWVSFLNDPAAGAVAIGMGLVMALCRFITTTPVFQSQPKQLDGKTVDPVEPVNK